MASSKSKQVEFDVIRAASEDHDTYEEETQAQDKKPKRFTDIVAYALQWLKNVFLLPTKKQRGIQKV